MAQNLAQKETREKQSPKGNATKDYNVGGGVSGMANRKNKKVKIKAK